MISCRMCDLFQDLQHCGLVSLLLGEVSKLVRTNPMAEAEPFLPPRTEGCQGLFSPLSGGDSQVGPHRALVLVHLFFTLL